MRERISKLTVRYNNKIVGYLAELDEGKIAFQYEDDWLKTGFSISPFSLPLSNQIYINSKDTFSGLYGVFNDSLPDGWGELLTRRSLAKKGINYDNLSPLTKLTLISKCGLGALTYQPSLDDTKTPNYTFDELALKAQKIFVDEDVECDKIYLLGGSSGGARPKVHIKDENDYWIVKFPCRIDTQNIGIQEYKANALAKQCGINVNETKLFASNLCEGYFAAKRFDRDKENNIHMISLSAILETTHRIPNLDYIYLFQVIKCICPNKNDLFEAYRRMCFNVLFGNKDDHGKNFSFLYDEKIKGYKLSPAYDITHTLYKPEHEMAVNGSGNPSINDLLEVASIIKLSMKRCKNIIKDIQNILNEN